MSTLTPNFPRVPLGDCNVHFDHNYVSIQTVKIQEILTTPSNINLEEDPTVTFSKSSSWQFLITEVEILLRWLGNLGVKGLEHHINSTMHSTLEVVDIEQKHESLLPAIKSYS